MSASRDDLSSWYDEGVRMGATHMIIGYDDFDHENFPVYIMPADKVEDRCAELIRGGNRYDEIYSYSAHYTKEGQMAEFRAKHTD